MSSITSPALERLLSITSDDSFIDRCNSSALSGYGIPESELEKIRQTLSPGFAGGGGGQGEGEGEGWRGGFQLTSARRDFHSNFSSRPAS